MGLLGKTAKAGSGLLDELIKSYNALQSAGEKVPDSLLDAMSKEYDKVKPKTHLDGILAQGEKADLPSDVLSQGYKPDVFHHVGSPNMETYDFGADRVSGGTTPAGLYTHNRMRDSKVYEGIATENNRPWERYSVVSSTDKPFVVGETKPNDELRNNFIKQMELKFGDKYSELPDHKRGYYDEKIEKFMQHGNTSSSPLTPIQQRQVYLDSGYDSLLLNGNEMVFLDTGKVRDLRADFNKADVGKEGLFKSAPVATTGAGILGLAAMASSDDADAGVLGKAKGLLMDTPSRMARAKEQGFDVDNPVYHGTNADIDAFKINDDGINLVGRGIYAADAHTAGGYSGGVNPSVYPLNVRGKKATNEDAASARDAIGKDWDNDLVNDWLSERGFTHRDGRHGIVVFDPKNLRSVNAAFDPAKTGSSNLLASNPAATTGAGILGLGAAAQSNDTYADYSPSNLARLKSDDVGSIEAPQSMAAANIAGLMGSVNKVGYDDPLLGMVASQLPSELMNKIAYNDKRGLLDYAKAYAGLLGF